MKSSTISLLTAAIAAVNFAQAEANYDEELVVTGSYFNNYQASEAKGALRMPVSVMETAQSVAVIPQVVIDEQLATTLGEVLSNDASLSAGSKQRNREVFNMRGFTLSSSTGYLRNGHQHWSHYQQPIELLERVEVIKGPSSILYGQSGPGGLVNMVTKKPSTESVTHLSIDSDQEGSSRLLVDTTGAIDSDDVFSYRAIAMQQQEKYDRVYANGENRERDRNLGSLVLAAELSENMKLSLHYDRTNDKAGLDTGAWLDADGKVIGSRDTIRDMSWAFTDITVENTGADLDLEMTDSLSLSVGINRQNFERQRFESSPRYSDGYQVGDSYTSRPYDRHDDWQFTTAYVDLKSEFSTFGLEHTLLVGVNYLDYYYGQLRVSASAIDYIEGNPEPTRPDVSYHTDDTLSETEYHYYGYYIQDLIDLNDQWQLSLGGRLDRVKREGANSDHFLPKAGLLFHPTDNQTYYLSYSESFEPASSEYLDSPFDRNDGMALSPVTSAQVELGTKLQLLDDKLFLSGAIFSIEREGAMITQAIVDPVYDSVTTQSGLQRHQGIELTASGSLTDRWFLLSSMMYLDAEYIRDANYQGKRTTDTPEFTSSLWTRYELSESFALNAGVFYVGERFADADNLVTKDAYTRFDIGAVYELEVFNSDLELRLNVENLFDRDYLAGGGVSNVTIGQGRYFKLAAHLTI